MTELLILFLVSVLWDALITLDLHNVIEKKPGWSFVSSVVLTVLALSVYAQVFVIGEFSWWKVGAVSLGAGVGTALVTWWRKRKSA